MGRSIKRVFRLEPLETRETPSISAVGPEFRLNTFTTGNQSAPAIALDADGDFVAAWASAGEDGAGNGIVARRFGKDGAALGGSFLVNTYTTGDQIQSAVATNAAGDFVVTWASSGPDGDGFGIFARRYDAAGNAIGGEFQVNEFTIGNQSAPAVGMNADGGFVVAWTSFEQLGQAHEVYARRYSANGVALGGEFRANSFTIDAQTNPAIGMNALGDFVVAWHSTLQDGSGVGVYAQAYHRDGALNGGEFRVNTFTTGNQLAPGVAVGASGAFLIVWQSDNQASPTSSNDMFAQRFGADALPVGNDFLVNSITTGPQTQVAVAADLSGDFVVGFSSNHNGTNDIAIRPGTSGGTLDTQLTANTYTTATQSQPSLALSANGDFVVVWSGEGTGDSYGIYAQRYDQSVDDAGPFVTGVYLPGRTTPLIDGDTVSSTVPSVTIAFSEDMSVTGGSGGANSVTNRNNWQLRLNGTDIAGAAIASITYGFNSLTRRFEATFNLAAPLTVGVYQIEPSAALQDLAGNAIDGNFDGTPGGGFIRSFRVAQPTAIGPEFRVNTTTTGGQIDSAVAADGDGDFVVAWTGPGPVANSYDVFAQRYAASGAPLGGQFVVNTFTTGSQSDADVGADAAGNFVVVWQSNDQDGGSGGIYGQRFNSAGAATGSEFRVNTDTSRSQTAPTIAMGANGSFVVVWASNNQDGNLEGVYAQRYDSSGAPAGGEFQVNVVTTGQQFFADAAMDANGNFIVTWQSPSIGSGTNIFLRRYTSNGVALDAADVLVNVVTTGDQAGPAVAAAADGAFVVAWTSQSGQDGSGSGVCARRYSAAGAALTGELAVNTTTTGTQFVPSVAVDASGDAVIVWNSAQSGDFDVYLQRFDPLGSPIGIESRVNATTTGVQNTARVAAQAQGAFIVTWASNDQDGSGLGIYGQRFGVAPPRVQSVQVNDGSAQRSRVTSLTVTFDSIVNFAGAVGDSLTLTRNGGGAIGFTATASIAGGVTVVTLGAFSGAQAEFGSLRDGRYTLSVLANQVSASGGQLDGNGDGSGGDNFTFGDAQGLFRFYGDMTGDRRIDISDFGFFSLAYLTPANYIPSLDFNNDGRIDIADFGQFSVRYFMNLP